MNRSGIWHLAPAFDLIHAYNPDRTSTSSHQMTLNGKWDRFLAENLLAAITASVPVDWISQIHSNLRLDLKI